MQKQLDDAFGKRQSLFALYNVPDWYSQYNRYYFFKRLVAGPEDYTWKHFFGHKSSTWRRTRWSSASAAPKTDWSSPGRLSSQSLRLIRARRFRSANGLRVTAPASTSCHLAPRLRCRWSWAALAERSSAAIPPQKTAFPPRRLVI